LLAGQGSTGGSHSVSRGAPRHRSRLQAQPTFGSPIRELAAIADRAFALAEEGRLLLVQKRQGPGDYSYLAIMPKRPSQRVAVAQPALNRSIPAPLDQVPR
jgi:hypothetical protein